MSWTKETSKNWQGRGWTHANWMRSIPVAIRMSKGDEMELKWDRPSALAGEVDPVDGSHLRGCLARLGYQVCLVTSGEEALEVLREAVFSRAVVGVELQLDDEPLLRTLSRLVLIERLVATGPGGDLGAERASHLAGGHLYLPRPVNLQHLAKALWLGPSRVQLSS
jgi:ActR/RegA family two-component response regulator